MVYHADQVFSGKGQVWHKECFTCNKCHRHLDSRIACDGPDKEVYCNICYRKGFGIKGYGFGQEDLPCLVGMWGRVWSLLQPHPSSWTHQSYRQRMGDQAVRDVEGRCSMQSRCSAAPRCTTRPASPVETVNVLSTVCWRVIHLTRIYSVEDVMGRSLEPRVMDLQEGREDFRQETLRQV